MKVQVRENYRQSGHKKVWDTVLSNYINMITIQIKMHANTLSYVLVIASVFPQLQLVSASCRFMFAKQSDTLKISGFIIQHCQEQINRNYHNLN